MRRVLALLVSVSGTWGNNDSWSQLWLRYDGVSPQYAARVKVPEVVCATGTSTAPILKRACDEVVMGLTGLLGATPAVVERPSAAGSVVMRLSPESADMAWPPSPDADGYGISTGKEKEIFVTVIEASSHRGLLNGAFRYLHLLRTEDSAVVSASFSTKSTPSSPLRMWNLWDNQDESIERGYSGKSVFEWSELPALKPRYVDYARLLASVGINAIVWDNVNACRKDNIGLVDSSHIKNFTPLANLFAEFGIWTFFVPCFADPIDIGKLKTADPQDTGVLEWWKAKAAELKAAMPSYRGFLVKADSEGQPGPSTYGRTELQGANMLAAALSPVDSIVIWRVFSHPPKGEDQALFQYELFAGWDGMFLPNVVIQSKSGPYDFQAREPVHALFGRMPKTNFMLEVQATQEYLGQARHLAHLPAQWDYYLSWDTGFLDMEGTSQNLGQYISGRATNQSFTGMAAVSNLGRDSNWAGHEMSAANTYGFGRLAWDPDLHAKTVTNEWVRATWGVDPEAVSVISAMLLESWETYENYTSPLGAGFICAGDHYHIDPGHREGVWLLNASETAIGNNRWSGFGQKYLEPVISQLGSSNPEDCPEEMLLSFHNVPYDYKLRSKGGMTVINYIYDSHMSGAAKTATWSASWQSLQGKVVETAYSQGVFDTVTSRLDSGASEAAAFANEVISWFEQKTGIPGPGPVPTPAPPAPSPEPMSYSKTSGHCWEITGQDAARVRDDKLVSLDACAKRCDADTNCLNFDHRAKDRECRLYNGAPKSVSSGNGFDAYAKNAFTMSGASLLI